MNRPAIFLYSLILYSFILNSCTQKGVTRSHSSFQAANPDTDSEFSDNGDNNFKENSEDNNDEFPAPIAENSELEESLPLLNPNQPSQPSTNNSIKANDPMLNNLWSLKARSNNLVTSNAQKAWQINTDCRNVVVGVMDSGITLDHPDLKDNLWIDTKAQKSIHKHGRNFANFNKIPEDEDSFAHGTHIAGTIGARGNNNTGVVGICWQAQIAALSVTDAISDQAYNSAVAEGLHYAVNKNIKIINASFGQSLPKNYKLPQVYQDALKRFTDSGGILVVAAGNENKNNDFLNDVPSNYVNPDPSKDTVISVANHNGLGKRAQSSHFGIKTVDLAAPGGTSDGSDLSTAANFFSNLNKTILSTVNTKARSHNGKLYGHLTGTSMSTPHVVGAAALYWSHFPEKTALEVKNAILDTVYKLPEWQNITTSGGVLDIYELMQNN